MIVQTIIFAVLLLIMWTIVILLVWHDANQPKIVRCKDCNKCDGFGGATIEPNEVGLCKPTQMCVKPGDYCSYGKRKEAEK